MVQEQVINIPTLLFGAWLLMIAWTIGAPQNRKQKVMVKKDDCELCKDGRHQG